MNRTLKKLAIIAGTAIPAAAMLFGTASAGVSALSKVKNGAFDNNTTHWSATVSPTAKLTAGFGVLKISNTTNTLNSTHAYAYQCIAINDKNKVEVAGKIKIISGQARTGSANLGLTYFPNEHCTGAPLASGFTQMVTQVGVWKSQKVVMTPPAGTKSAWIRLGVVKAASQQLPQAFLPFSVYFDDVQVVTQLIKFPPIYPTPTQTPVPQDPPQQPPADDQDDPAPDPTPAPQDQPQQPQDDPTPAPQDEPADEPNDEPAPADEPAPGDGETIEEDVPGPDVPDEPYSEEDGSDSSSDDPSENGSSSDGDDSNSSDGEDSQGTSSEGDQESDVQTLGEAEGEKPAQPTKKTSPKNGAPTPEAPSAGNAAAQEKGLLGTTELAIIGGFAVVGLMLTFLVTSRRKRQPVAADEDYYID